MRTVILALISVSALAACNPAAPAGDGADTGGAQAGFPTTTTSYRADATLTDPNSGQSVQAVQYRDGGNVRMEMPGVTSIINSSTREAFSIMDMEGRSVAMRLPFDTVSESVQVFQADPGSLTRGGACSGAGESGTEWTHVDPDGKQTSSCVTSDGILLRASANGQTAWETTRVQRGAQSADLFTLPAGVQVMDLGNVGSAMTEALEAAKQRDN